MEIERARIVVTGAGSGIACALLQQLAEHDCRLLAVDVDGAALTAAVAATAGRPAQVHALCCDLAQRTEVDRLFEQAQALLGGIDLFFANAGFAYYERIAVPDWERLDRIFRLNVLSTIYSAEKLAALEHDRPYRLVVTGSAMGLLALPGYAVYGSTKAALHHFAESYRTELADPRAIAMVYPIATRTGFFHRASARPAPLPWPVQSAEHVAAAILRGVVADHCAIHPSRLFRLVHLVQRLAPPLGWLIQRLERRRFERWLAERAQPDWNAARGLL